VTTSMDRLLVLAPMSSELRPLVRALGARRTSIGETRVHVTEREGRTAFVGQIGVGPEQAMSRTSRLLDAVQPDIVVVCGISGGIDPAMTVGTTLAPEVVVDVQQGTQHRPVPLPGLEPGGVLGSSAQLVLDDGRLASLADRGIVAVDMEAAGVAEVCERRGVPWSVVRVVSDRPDDRIVDNALLGLLEPDGSTNPWRALRFVVTHPARWPQLFRLGRDSALATKRAARVTLRACGWIE
jgi:adenosylhomocysteine nucleosidase